MSDTPVPPPQYKQFKGRNWLPPEAPTRARVAGTPPVPGPTTPPTIPVAAAEPGPVSPKAPVIAHGLPSRFVHPTRPTTDRDRLFERYADLRQRMGESCRDRALIAEAAQVAEDLSLTLEAMELWRACLQIDPTDTQANTRLAGLDRRAAATGETGAKQASTYKQREHPPEAPAFWTNLPALLAFPFRGNGRNVFIGASIFFAAGEVLATFNVFFGWFVGLCLWGYLAAWQFDVLSRSAAGKDDPPEFPELITIIDSCVLPCVGFLGCLVFSFSPLIACLVLTIQGTLSPTVGVVAMLVSFIPCAFAFPMSMTLRALTESTLDAMQPARVYGSIGRVLPDYVMAFLALCVLWFGWAVVRVGLLFVIGIACGVPTADALIHLDYVRIVGWLLYTAAVWPLLLYVWCVQGHLLGCLYRQSYKRLAWFVPPGLETERATRLSGAVALAGLGGALLLAGGGWLTFLMWPGDRAGAIVSASPCPMAAGSELTYFWENTDGPAGLTTYRFEANDADKLGIAATYKHCGNYGITGGEGPVGVISQKSGKVLRADGEEAGLSLVEKAGRHSRFFGPKRSSLNRTYLNDWSVRGESRWMGTWNAWRVVDPDTSTELYYDKATGVLVGRKFTGVGFTVTEWLCGVKRVEGIGACPPANRNFDMPEASDLPLPEFPLGGEVAPRTDPVEWRDGR